MNAILDNTFVTEISETECTIDPYSDLLDRIVASCPDHNLVLESQQWSKLQAIQNGGTIYEPSELAGDALPFDPSEVFVQITYDWDRENEEWGLAWVATFEWLDEP